MERTASVKPPGAGCGSEVGAEGKPSARNQLVRLVRLLGKRKLGPNSYLDLGYHIAILYIYTYTHIYYWSAYIYNTYILHHICIGIFVLNYIVEFAFWKFNTYIHTHK